MPGEKYGLGIGHILCATIHDFMAWSMRPHQKPHFLMPAFFSKNKNKI